MVSHVCVAAVGVLLVVGIVFMTDDTAALAQGGRLDKFPEVAKLPARPELPDALTMLDGSPVKTADEWAKQRRPELKALFQHYMYGYFPAAPEVTAKVEHLDKKALGGKATLKDITLTIGGNGPKIHLLLVVPNKRQGPAPVFVGLNFRGNHTVLDDPNIRLPQSWLPKSPATKDNKATDAGRGTEKTVWNVEDIIDRGYALATVYCGDIEPDRADKREGVQAFFRGKGEKPGHPQDWATIAAWAWGVSRVIDYLAIDPDIDAGRIIVVGHSRLGKTALLAGAFDERIRVVMPHQAGCGGTAPSRSRNPKAESVKRINTSFPHWFNGTFKEFNDAPEKIPFDQHCLVALCAPRPVLFTNALEDQWANPDGQFEMLQAADKVYRLLGAGGLEAKKMPELKMVVDSTLGYYIRPGQHSMNRDDWQVFLDYADKHATKK